MKLSVGKVTNNALALTNCAFVAPEDFVGFCQEAGIDPDGQRAQSNGAHAHVGSIVLSLKATDQVESGVLALNMVQRISANLEMGKPILVEPLGSPAEHNEMASFSLEMDVLNKSKITGNAEVECEEITKHVKSHFLMQCFTQNQVFFVKHMGLTFRIKVGEVHTVSRSGEDEPEEQPATWGQLVKSTNIMYRKHKDAPLKLKGAAGNRTNKLFERGFNFQALGIGGLDKEFSDIFRRAFSSRVFPADVVRKMGISHVRGMLLFGPPGCGKTLIARQIGKALNAHEPKIVNGPQILDKYVGGSEEKIRALFVDAEQEQAEKGDASELHIVIFDEIDAICKKRGSTRDGTGVHDSIVNQLLSKIDGVDALNNVLIIGMTNRKDMIDPALLRPGRLEVHIEIGLPDDVGRVQILNIHTREMRDAGYLDAAVSLDKLAAETKNYTGAELEGLVKSAASYAFERSVDVRNLRMADASKIRVQDQDFERALSEVKPAFGKEDDELRVYYRNGIVPYGEAFEHVKGAISQMVSQVRTSERTPLMSVLLEGREGSGKTALAAQLAVQSGFPFVKLISADSMLGMSDSGRCAHIAAVFNDAYKSPMSMIILDDLERLLDYVPLGPRFSNPVLQTLLVLIKKEPPTEGRRLMVIGTTSLSSQLAEMGLVSAFNVRVQVPMLEQPEEVAAVLHEDGDIAAEEVERISASIKEPIPVRKLFLVLEMARQSGGAVTYEAFMDCMLRVGWGF